MVGKKVNYFLIFFSIPLQTTVQNTNPLSLAGLTLVLATNLGLSSDLPTFFRHSESWNTSVKSLLIIQLVSVGLGLLSLYFGSLINHGFEVNETLVMGSGSSVLRIALISYLFISVICANVANVYSASVGWEILAPKAFLGRKEYLILGLTLTTIFILLSNLIPLDFLLAASDISLVNLCIILVIGSMITKRLKAKPNVYLQGTYFLAWLIPTLLTFFQSDDEHHAYSLTASILVITSVIGISLISMFVYRYIKQKK